MDLNIDPVKFNRTFLRNFNIFLTLLFWIFYLTNEDGWSWKCTVKLTSVTICTKGTTLNDVFSHA